MWLSLIKAGKPWCVPDITSVHLTSECYHFFPAIWIIIRERGRDIILKILTAFPVSKESPKMKFFVDDTREPMKTWRLMHWEASVVLSSCMMNGNGMAPIFFQPWNEWYHLTNTTSILFHGPYLRNFAPNYLTLHSPNIHYYFPPLCFCSWHFIHQKMSPPSSHVFKHCPSLKTLSHSN